MQRPERTQPSTQPNGSIGQRVKQAREAHGWSQMDLVQHARDYPPVWVTIAIGWLGMVETNALRSPGAEKLLKLAWVLDTSIEWLVFGELDEAGPQGRKAQQLRAIDEDLEWLRRSIHDLAK